jgi:uncharacterized phage protein (TIGR02218 family)
VKRLMPTLLIDWLLNNRNCLKADLFQLVLPNGQVISATEGQMDLTVPSGTPGWSGATTTFSSTKYGVWNRGSITSESGFNLHSNSMTLTCVPQPTTLYPAAGSTLGLLSAAFNGLFDASQVTVWTAYMPTGNYGNVSNGLETKFIGNVTKISDINRTKVEFDCNDSLYLLNMKVPTRLYQSNCPWSFCDSNCTLSAPLYTQAFTAKTGSTQLNLIPVTAFPQAAGYFTQGVVSCTGGKNSGLSQSVLLHASGTLQMTIGWLLPVSAGDTFSVIKGCDKTLPTCAATTTAAGAATNNTINFGGHPYIPPSSSAV